jgi:3-phosphoshikimate 1-carboxyvinyltransferase
MKITPGPVSSGTVRTYDDHRMAMAFSLLGLVVPGIRIQNPSCVTKTLPDYFQRLEALRP